MSKDRAGITFFDFALIFQEIIFYLLLVYLTDVLEDSKLKKLQVFDFFFFKVNNHQQLLVCKIVTNPERGKRRQQGVAWLPSHNREPCRQASGARHLTEHLGAQHPLRTSSEGLHLMGATPGKRARAAAAIGAWLPPTTHLHLLGRDVR